MMRRKQDEVQGAEGGGDAFVCDTSVIFNGQILDLIEGGDLGGKPTIIVPNVVVAEIEYRYNVQKEIGHYGLNVLKELRERDGSGEITLEVVGGRPTKEEIELSPGGELDAMIRREAKERGAYLITTDRLQGDIGEFEGVELIYAKDSRSLRERTPEELRLVSYFDGTTMSVHLKRGIPASAKKGSPGNWRLERVSEEPLSRGDMEDIALGVVEFVREDDDSFIEIERDGALVAQLREFRIVITRPPFSNDIEITSTRPLVELDMSDYSIDEQLRDRFDAAEGILVCGSPGAGKSTFSAALANYYLAQEKVVKTLESVRDLQVKPEITQYTRLAGDDDDEKTLENAADILLLVRPDFTIFDEVRTTSDFEIYTDFRLSGVGMVGVVHSSSAIDAVQRFIGRVELGMLPSIIDTIVFVEDGDISDVLTVRMTVKVPTGFKDKDLARPVVEVKEYSSDRVVFEIYSFGQDMVLNPVHPLKKKGRSKARGRGGAGKKIDLDIQKSKGNILVRGDELEAMDNLEMYSGNKLIFTGTVGKEGVIRINLSSREGQKIHRDIKRGGDIYGKIRA